MVFDRRRHIEKWEDIFVVVVIVVAAATAFIALLSWLHVQSVWSVVYASRNVSQSKEEI